MKINKALAEVEVMFSTLHRGRADLLHAESLGVEVICVNVGVQNDQFYFEIQVRDFRDFKALAHRNVSHRDSSGNGFDHIHLQAECAYGTELVDVESKKVITEEMWAEINEMESWSTEGKDG